MKKSIIIICFTALCIALTGCSSEIIGKKCHAICSSGFNGACIFTDNPTTLKKDNNCITDGKTQICGTYQDNYNYYSECNYL